MQKWHLPAQPTRADVGAAPCVPVSAPDTRSCCEGSVAWGLQAGTQPAQGRVNPLLALTPHTEPLFPCAFTQPVCPSGGTWSRDRSQRVPEGLDGLSAHLTPCLAGQQPPQAEKLSFYHRLSCFLFLKWLKATPLLLQKPRPQCPHTGQEEEGGKPDFVLLSPKSPRSQLQPSSHSPLMDKRLLPGM